MKTINFSVAMTVCSFFLFLNSSSAYLDTKTDRIEAMNQKLLSSDLISREALPGKIVEKYKDCSLVCRNTNSYTYDFLYKKTEGQSLDWSELNKNEAVQKCQKIKVNFSLIGDWGATFDKQCVTREEITIIPPPVNTHGTPPADILECSNQEDCLSKGKEHILTPDANGKGVHKVPSNFVSNTEKTFASGNNLLPCSDGICQTMGSGKFKLTTTAQETEYYGQCKGFGFILNPPVAKIPAITSALDLTVKNRPPIATVSFEKPYLNEGETTKVYCNVVDPDNCSDKIVKVKWKCMDSQGNDNNCFFLDGNQVFRQGELYKEITPANPYRDTVDLKLNKKETYAITCEAWDNDNANALSGAGINSIKVGDPVCITDGYCDSKCGNDRDCGVIPDGSCYVTRTKPPFDVAKIKPSTKVTFEARIFGGLIPQKYTWFCDKDNPASIEIMSTEKTDNHTCTNYTLDNHTYEPKVVVTYPNGETKECANNEGTAVTTDGLAPSQVGFCIVVPDEGGTDNSACGDKATAKLKAYTNYDLDNPIYQWSNCPGAENKANVTCNYETSKLQEKFTPALTIVNDGKEIKCPSNTSVTLYKESSCKVLSRVKGSGEDYAKNPASRVGDVLETKIERKCLDPKEIISWEAVGTSLQKSNNDSAEASLNSAGNVTIKAKVKVGDKFVDCEESSTDVKQMIQEGV